MTVAVNDNIYFYNTQNPTDPNPAPGVVTEVLSGNAIHCEITLSDSSTRMEYNVNPYDPTAGMYRYWEPGL